MRVVKVSHPAVHLSLQPAVGGLLGDDLHRVPLAQRQLGAIPRGEVVPRSGRAAVAHAAPRCRGGGMAQSSRSFTADAADVTGVT